jgi:peptidase inhibitor family I36
VRRSVFVAVPATMMTALVALMMITVSAEAEQQKVGNSSFGAQQCPANAVCLFTDRNWRGVRLIDRTGNGMEGYERLDDTAGSIVNNTRNVVCLYEFEDFEGKAIFLRPNHQFFDMGGWDDSISSHRPCRRS